MSLLRTMFLRLFRICQLNDLIVFFLFYPYSVLYTIFILCVPGVRFVGLIIIIIYELRETKLGPCGFYLGHVKNLQCNVILRIYCDSLS